jgi:hypothetical protein
MLPLGVGQDGAIGPVVRLPYVLYLTYRGLLSLMRSVGGR